MTRCAAYLRISKDGEGLGLGIERQRNAVTELAASKGWTIDPRWTFEENSTSAWDDSKPRPGFERLLTGMETGQVEAVVVYSFDRLARRLRDAARVLDLVDKHGVSIATSTGDLDLSTAYGRGIAGILGSIANMEITQMSERLKAKAEQNARAGKVVNGGRRRYGYTANRSALVEAEASSIREVSNRLIGGATLSGVVRDLNDRNVLTSYGKRWTVKKLRATLTHPALCGRVEFRGEVLHGVIGQWPTILDEESFDALQVVIAARSRLENEWVSHRVHLLSGFAKCGVEGCGGKMIGHLQTNGKWTYTCNVRKHLGRDKANLDAYILAEVKHRAAETYIEVPEWVDEDRAKIRRQIAELEERKLAAVRQLVDGKIGADVLTAVTAEFDTRIRGLEDTQVHRVLSETLDAVVFDLDQIETKPISDQSAAVQMFVQRLTILPAKRLGRGFDPASVEVVWRDMAELQWHAVVERGESGRSPDWSPNSPPTGR